MAVQNSVLDRRSILAGAGATLVSGIAGPAGAAAASAWQTVAPSEIGFADLEQRFDRLIAGKRVWNLHGVIVARGGRIVLERYSRASRIRGADYLAGRSTVPAHCTISIQ
jgi:hypothetical protein